MNRLGGVAALVVIVALGGEAFADSSTDPNQHIAEPTVEQDKYRSKKDRLLDDKTAAQAKQNDEDKAAWQQQLDKRIGKEPKKVINIFNTWTHEYVVVDYVGKRRKEKADKLEHGTVDQFLRCHFTNEPTGMDKRLFSVLVEAANHFGSQRVDIISGFRAPKYNLMLRKKGRGVARNSQHPKGNAVDFRVRGVAASRLRSWAQALRLGGVGYYPSSGFVHVDTGRVRTWTGK